MLTEEQIDGFAANWDFNALDAWFERREALSPALRTSLAEAYEGLVEQMIVDICCGKIEAKSGYSLCLDDLERIEALVPGFDIDELKGTCYSGLAEFEDRAANLRKSIALFEALIRREPDNARAHWWLGRDLFDLMLFENNLDNQGLGRAFGYFKAAAVGTAFLCWRESLRELEGRIPLNRHKVLFENYQASMNELCRDDARVYAEWGNALLRLYEVLNKDLEILAEAAEVLERGLHARFDNGRIVYEYAHDLHKIAELTGDDRFRGYSTMMREKAVELNGG